MHDSPAAARPRPAAAVTRSFPLQLAALTLLLLAASLLTPSPAHAAPPSSVSVHDTTGSVEQDALEQELATVDFRTEVELVVLVLDVTDHGYQQSQDTALNDAVLAHARDSDPELLSEDGQYFAEGTVIIALDPDNRFLGAYAGEDVKLDDGGFSAVQEAMTEDAQDGQWHAALMAGAEEYAGLLLRPWWQHPSAVLAGVVALSSAVIVAGSILGMRRTARRRMDEALPRYQDVLDKRALTDAAARTLPTGSPYARAALRDHAEYGEQIDEAARLHAELPAPAQRSWGWGFASSQRELARRFGHTVEYLDDTDDDIIAAADLLHRIGDWRAGWERELKPLQDSVAGLDAVLEERDQMSQEELEAATGLMELGGDTSAEMESLTAQLQEDRIDPDSALERLDTLTRELSAAVLRLQSHRIGRLAQDDAEEALMRETATSTDGGGDYRSLRARRHHLEHGGSGSSLFWNLSPVLWYSSWHQESDSALDSHRDPSAAGGSTAGFSGGASFSGAGSSGRF